METTLHSFDEFALNTYLSDKDFYFSKSYDIHINEDIYTHCKTYIRERQIIIIAITKEHPNTVHKIRLLEDFVMVIIYAPDYNHALSELNKIHFT